MGAEGAGRRLSEDDERRGAEAFAAGASEREVADLLGCSASTAHRLRERLQQPAQAEADGPEITPVHPFREADGEMERLEADRAELQQVVETWDDRAESCRQAITGLEAERLAALEAGRDAAPLRPRFASAREDLADAELAAQLARGRLAAVKARIADLTAMRELAAMRAELEAAIVERDAQCARTGDRQRASVLAVRDAAVEFTAALADERAATDRVEQLRQAVAARARAAGELEPVVPLPAPTAVGVPSDFVAPQPVALARAISEAQIGRTEAVAVRLAEAYGWLPRDPAEVAAEYERMRQLQAPAPPSPPSVQHPGHWPASVSLDSQGRPLVPPDPERQRQQQAVRPGALGFTSWPR